MRVICLTRANLDAGAECFRDYERAAILTSDGGTAKRPTGFDMIPGVAFECHVLFDEPEHTVTATARATECSEATVRAVLDALGGVDLAGVCWIQNNPEYVPFQPDDTDVLLARA
jgi:hypothetical protein